MSKQVHAALARKLTAGQDEVDDNPRSIPRALRLGLARAAGDGFGMALTVIGIKQATRAQEKLSELALDNWLFLRFAFDDGGAAIVCVDAACVSAIVQQQTIGTVLPDMPQPRAFTGTDAAMTAPLVEDMFARALQLVDTASDAAFLAGLEFVAQAEDWRAASLGLTAETYHVFDLTTDLAKGARQGHVRILLPKQETSESDSSDQQARNGPRLECASGVMRAELNAVISRLSLPLKALSDLSTGDVVPLSNAQINRIELLNIDRKCVAVGRLGLCHGMRAIRTNEHKPLQDIENLKSPDFLTSVPMKVSDSGERPDDGVQALHVDTLADGKSGSTELMPTHDLSLSDTDQILAEINQLAGLNDTVSDRGDG